MPDMGKDHVPYNETQTCVEEEDVLHAIRVVLGTARDKDDALLLLDALGVTEEQVALARGIVQ
jgi:hypothetical protein